jgi:hypothetical protein
MGQQEMAMTGKNRVMIYGPKDGGTYVVEFRTAEGDVLAIPIPRTEAAVIRRFQERMPYGLSVPDVNAGPTRNQARRGTKCNVAGWGRR